MAQRDGTRTGMIGYGDRHTVGGHGDLRTMRGCDDRRTVCGHGDLRTVQGCHDRRTVCGYGDLRTAPGCDDRRTVCGYGDLRTAQGYDDRRTVCGYGDLRTAPGCDDRRRVRGSRPRMVCGLSRDTRTGLCGHRGRPVGWGHAARGRLLILCLLGLVSTCHGANSYVFSPTRVATSDITCWTCNEGKTTNEECNNWAADIKCPINNTVCQTVHTFTSPRGPSVSVTKRCVHSTQCTPQHVGCTPSGTSGQQVCVSCCDYNYCNEGVAYNRTSALRLSTFTSLPSSSPLTAVTTVLTLGLCGLAAVLIPLWSAGVRTS